MVRGDGNIIPNDKADDADEISFLEIDDVYDGYGFSDDGQSSNNET